MAAARAISELTHFDPEAGDACVLWCCAIRHAVLHRRLDVRIGLRHIDSSRRDVWSKRLDAAESVAPVGLRQQRLGGRRAAGRMVGHRHHAHPGRRPRRGVFRADHLRLALDAAVRAGDDTDTVAAIAGGLLGAAYGASAVPLEWRTLLHGWPGIDRARIGSTRRGHRTQGKTGRVRLHLPRARRSTPSPATPTTTASWLGGIGALRSAPRGC